MHNSRCNARLRPRAASDSSAFGVHPSSQDFGRLMSTTAQREPGTILLAEDETLLRELGQTILSQAGYKVLTAGGAQQLVSLVNGYSGEIERRGRHQDRADAGAAKILRLHSRVWVWRVDGGGFADPTGTEQQVHVPWRDTSERARVVAEGRLRSRPQLIVAAYPVRPRPPGVVPAQLRHGVRSQVHPDSP